MQLYTCPTVLLLASAQNVVKRQAFLPAEWILPHIRPVGFGRSDGTVDEQS
jgi:hypothetical protein